MLDGRRGACRRDGRDADASRERCRDRHGAQPRHDLRPRWRAGADPLHRTQRDGRDQGAQRRAHGHEGRRHALCIARQRDQDHARNRRGHEDEIQGDVARRVGCERHRMLIFTVLQKSLQRVCNINKFKETP
ncbi:Sarcosine oxidase beta subunit [Caballeronia sordidicola]|uniref:Sarcosine oxidase beta subunit n=1 Tax=Caballeronia sordidicola TaxID=196367 RepID=A0A226WSC0_CABSO|nr:Sarcosine oxidase beta subunit [Caballeronia sordidicola]